MCGITAIVTLLSTIENRRGMNFIIDSLKQLQNRGYDSAGICSVSDGRFEFIKYATIPDISAIDRLEEGAYAIPDTGICFGHTRWATHGEKIDINSHPHLSTNKKIAVVHNGIIDNYKEIRDRLEKDGYKFLSQTDTEVISNLLEWNYRQSKDMSKAISSTVAELHGTWGLVIACTDYPDTLFCVRHGSPLLFSFDDDKVIITSEISGFCGKMTNYNVLENNDICIIQRLKDEISIETMAMYTPREIPDGSFEATPDPYEHWTIKEINEQPESVLRAINLGGRLLDTNRVRLGGLEMHKNELLKLDNVILLGCGTSYNACMLGSYYMKEICNFETVQVFDGDIFQEHDIPRKGKTGLIFLSQSGETKDLRRCLQIGKDNNLYMIGIVNVVDSLIAREVDCGCYLNAGREVGVASTKSFTSQAILLILLSIWFSQNLDINDFRRTRYVSDVRKLSMDVSHTINDTDDKCKEIANILAEHTSCFILARVPLLYVCVEGALKMKEIGYIHAEAYGLNALRHGPYALITPGSPVILIATEMTVSAVNNIIEEVKSRGAYVIVISTVHSVSHHADKIIMISNNNTCNAIIVTVVFQLIAYHMAVKKNINPDKPRNLAKCVTV